MTRKSDPRALRTKAMLKKAVISLLQTGTSVEKLTIQQVATAAGLNRTTFYLHYEDIQALVSSLMKEILAEIDTKIAKIIELEGLSRQERLEQLLDYLHTQRHYLFVLFQTEQFESQLFNAMKTIISIRRDQLETPTANSFVDIDIKTASLVGIIMWWLKAGLQYSSAYIAAEIEKMYR